MRDGSLRFHRESMASKLDQKCYFEVKSFSGFSHMGSVELALATEEAGCGRAIDADELTPLGGGHTDVFEVGG